MAKSKNARAKKKGNSKSYVNQERRFVPHNSKEPMMKLRAYNIFDPAYAVTDNYNRPKSTVVNVTGMVLTLLVAEKPDSPGAIGGAGDTAELDCRIQADADESGGADVQDLYKIEALPDVAADGVVTVLLTVTPILGDGTDGTPKLTTVTHDENMDVWQAAAGRARQA